jgi:hypothetical protein
MQVQERSYYRSRFSEKGDNLNAEGEGKPFRKLWFTNVLGAIKVGAFFRQIAVKTSGR